MMFIKDVAELRHEISKLGAYSWRPRTSVIERREVLEVLRQRLRIEGSGTTARSFGLFVRTAIRMLDSSTFKELSPLGLVGHFGPGNYAINAAYSWLAGFICGNLNIVRISRRATSEDLAVFEIIGRVLQEMGCKDFFVGYLEATQVTELISSIVDARIVWGSDLTVKQFRGMQTRARCRDIFFGHSDSICIVDLDLFFSQSKTIKQFLINCISNDLFLAEGGPCTAASNVVVVSKKMTIDLIRSKAIELLAEAEAAYNQKNRWSLESFNMQTATLQRFILDKAYKFESLEDSSLRICFSSQVEAEKLMYRSLFVIPTSDPWHVLKALKRRPSTVSQYGFSDCLNELYSCTGSYRITEIGQAHSFQFAWDGVDLIRSLSVCRSNG